MQRDKRSPRLRMSVLSLTLFGVTISPSAQDRFHLQMKITGHTYTDEKITVSVPQSWTVAIDSGDDGTYLGAILRKGRYVLRLCTACGQASGIVGGRFNEIAGMVQPWYRSDPLAKPSPCGTEKETRISKHLDRVDFWFHRDPAHSYDEDTDDCRQPKTTATIWYGSYFAEHCSFVRTGRECGGYFLHRAWLTDQPPAYDSPSDEMAFAVTFEQDDLDQLPHQSNLELQRVLRETTAIVRSIVYKRPRLHNSEAAQP